MQVQPGPLKRKLFMALLSGWLALGALPTTSLAFENTMAERTRACTACHGDQGRAGPDGYYPRLAGKPAGYLYNQLENFQQGRRQYGLMQALIDPLSRDYLRAMAVYFSELHIPYPAPAPATAPPAVLASGRTLVLEGDVKRGLPACVSCHGQALTGVQPFTPGLLGLPRDYLNAQLGGWQTGQRKGHSPDCMATIAKRLSDADVNAISQWLSSQPVPANSTAVATRPAQPRGTPALPDCGSAP
ncbi:Cytochrome c-like domain containing protein [Comamonadaceae bacterium]